MSGIAGRSRLCTPVIAELARARHPIELPGIYPLCGRTHSRLASTSPVGRPNGPTGRQSALEERAAVAQPRGPIIGQCRAQTRRRSWRSRVRVESAELSANGPEHRHDGRDVGGRGRRLSRHRDSVLVARLRDSRRTFVRVLTGRERGVQRRSSVSAAVRESCRGVTSSRTRAISMPP